ncbi:putative Cell division control protein 7 [Hypsibius exemplaris]|uniref:Cell division control protein 7 n=1 Tax=Hypsibius exemplaris TaxID=2072580 RepID=A0A9X6RP00_HYPEX|nr:putative Cell division control protein 7 [Hypsibius exemplaris]
MTTIAFSGRKRVYTWPKTEYSFIGEDGWGTVIKLGPCKDNENNTYAADFALKILSNGNAIETTENLTQYAYLLKLDHVNILRYIDVGFLEAIMPRRLCFLTEFCPDGDLNSLAKSPGDLTLEQFISFFTQIVAGLAYLHTAVNPPIVHGDVKGSNIFLTNDKRTVKLGSIDGCDVLEDSRTSVQVMGTLGWMAPEVLSQIVGDRDSNPLPVGRATDIFSLGCTMVELLNGGVVPYVDKKGEPVLEVLQYSDMSPTVEPTITQRWREMSDPTILAHPDWKNTCDGIRFAVPDEYKNLLEGCLWYNSDERHPAVHLRDLLAHIKGPAYLALRTPEDKAKSVRALENALQTSANTPNNIRQKHEEALALAVAEIKTAGMEFGLGIRVIEREVQDLTRFLEEQLEEHLSLP